MFEVLSDSQSISTCVQLEVEFETLALLEQFWAAIPPVEHKAWSQRARVRIYEDWQPANAHEALTPFHRYIVMGREQCTLAVPIHALYKQSACNPRLGAMKQRCPCRISS